MHCQITTLLKKLVLLSLKEYDQLVFSFYVKGSNGIPGYPVVFWWR